MKAANKKILASAFGFSVIALVFAGAASAAPVDAAAAKALASKSGCFMCHAIDSQKVGPSYHSVAQKYKGNPAAEEKLIKHITVPNKVMVMGSMVEHDMVKSSDPAAIKNLVDWILSR